MAKKSRKLAQPSRRGPALAGGVTDWHLRGSHVAHVSRDSYLPKDQADDIRIRCVAALMTAPTGTVVSHHTAALLWRLPLPPSTRALETGRIHLTMAAPERVRHRSDRRIHQAVLQVVEWSVLDGLPVTEPSRTWLDLAGWLRFTADLVAITDAVLRTYASREQLMALLAANSGRRGVARARAALELANPAAESPQESRLRVVLVEAGLPEPRAQVLVCDRLGRPFARLDMAYEEELIGFEYDGDHHRRGAVAAYDRHRDRQLAALGWTVIRVTADELRNPGRFVAQVAAILRSRRRRK